MMSIKEIKALLDEGKFHNETTYGRDDKDYYVQ